MTDSRAFIEQVNEQRGEGTISSVYSLLYQRIGIPANLKLVPLNRQNRQFKQTDYAVCSLYRFKNEERAKKFAFSNMVYFLLHYNLYQQKEMPRLSGDVLDENGHVKSLPDLMQRYPNSKLLHIPSYSYGTLLDKQINELPKKSKAAWVGNSPHNRVSNMFFAGRADFALMFPAELASYIAVYPEADYHQYRVAGVNYATKGYMMCNKHQDSFAYIKQVNDALSQLYQDPAYLKAHTDPYSEKESETIKQEFVKIHQSIISPQLAQ